MSAAANQHPNRYVLIEESPGSELKQISARTLVEHDHFKAVQLNLAGGAELPAHHVPGPALIQCVAGHVFLQAGGHEYDLPAGTMVALPAAQPHRVNAHVRSTLYIVHGTDRADAGDPAGGAAAEGSKRGKETGPGKDAEPIKDVVQEASEESFPASDAPNWR